MRLRVSEIMKVCMNHPGMWDEFVQTGQLDGEFIDIHRGQFDKINKKFFKGGLGSLLHEVLGPPVAIIDSVLGTNLSECGGCAERELKINDALSGPDNTER